MKSLYICLAKLPATGTGCKKYLDIKPVEGPSPPPWRSFDQILDNDNMVRFNFIDNNLGSCLTYLADDVTLSEGLGKIFTKAASSHLDRYYATSSGNPIEPNTGRTISGNWVTPIFSQSTT